MGRDYSVIVDNVQAVIQDTSSAMKAVLEKYANRRYKQILRSINWEYINEDYTISVTAAAGSDYELPTDFRKEKYAVDTTNGIWLIKTTLEDIARFYYNNLTETGAVERYAIFDSDDGKKYIRFHKTPAASLTVALPYIAEPADLSADTDEPILGLEDLIEVGITADAWRYKRQFAKANAEEVRFNTMLMDYIWDKENQPNEVVRFKPVTFDKDNLY